MADFSKLLLNGAMNYFDSAKTPYQYINIRRDWSAKGVNGEGGSDETTGLFDYAEFQETNSDD